MECINIQAIKFNSKYNKIFKYYNLEHINDSKVKTII